jgi:hypothetical protein
MNNNKQQTAVEWLYHNLFPKQLDGFSEEEWSKIDKAFNQAKELEKQQIIKAYENMNSMAMYGEQYYNETFNTKEK